MAEEHPLIVVHHQKYDAAPIAGVPVSIGPGYVALVLFRCRNLMGTTLGTLMLEQVTCIGWFTALRLAKTTESSLVTLFGVIVFLLLATPYTAWVWSPAIWVRDIALLVGVGGAAILQCILLLTYVFFDNGFKLVWPLSLSVRVPKGTIPGVNDFLLISRKNEADNDARLDWEKTVLGIIQQELNSVTVMRYTDSYVLHSHKLLHEFILSCYFYIVAIVQWRLFGMRDVTHWFTNVDLVGGLAGVLALYAVFFVVKALWLLVNVLLCSIPLLIVAKWSQCRRAIFVRSLIRNSPARPQPPPDGPPPAY